tara:strand:- start:2295 stop:2492 length:198 start_codon:yes stop_codon:yes gene_type:complete
MANEPIDDSNIDSDENINLEDDITNRKFYKIRKYSFNFIVTSINLILFYLLIRYVIYPIFYTLLY